MSVHHGVVDQSTLSSRPPKEVMQEVINVLLEMGIDVKRENEFKLRCVRVRRRKAGPSTGLGLGSPTSDNRGDIRESADIHSVDSGDEVKFHVELCRIKNLPGLYSLTIKRIKGSVWSFKFIYQTVVE
ncbi:hypothetical protein TREMEDRAFT_31148 [Tremella mesenterica DSM 1558]|uniref:uncharacterized protein n=1 Tax=Tremella mesenterica (strain ATCC 24925 / CBS 8224 / DSM 1558 / NBRC 9311 / NRRL Y-6157 / RJB 2259-6 / UBC 559-6) TaxID=578456 RepID=UPI0003F4901C|nr:uncharacterized protein TREMEDRAFT_31148 [Tremella mesenterica DSM 1558]EIW69142.1 hypothetical protein TREMEDRAFT_31148 [Tremella mesenterica DSM 1558]